MGSPEIRRIVTEIYRTSLSLPARWTPEQREAFLDQQAEQLSYQVAELSAELAAQAIAEWCQRHGQHPDYMTTVGLHNTARSQAMETVLRSQLYEQIPQDRDDLDPMPEGEPLLDKTQVPWDQRWRQPPYRTDPSEEIEALIARIWPDPAYSAVFRIKAGYLLAARAEDALALPTHPEDPLTADLAQMVYRDLRVDGLPER